MKAYQLVQEARKTNRISSQEIIQALCFQFMECHGDRCQGDDSAIIGGIGMTDVGPVTIIGIQKGKNLQENIKRNFGSAGPAGYQKAIRLMKQAQKFNRPIICLINTAGAYCAPESEENGIGHAIAQSLLTMSQVEVPTLSIILGEGGSGGAIALALSDQVWMMEKSVYSILSPEGFAAILWKDIKLAAKAAELMKIQSTDLFNLKVCDLIIREMDDQGQVLDPKEVLDDLVNRIKLTISSLKQVPIQERLSKRYEKFRKF